MAFTEKELLRKKKEIENVKTEIAELEGERKALIKRLKEDWNCKDTQTAEKLLKSMETEQNELKETIEKQSEELELLFDED